MKATDEMVDVLRSAMLNTMGMSTQRAYVASLQAVFDKYVTPLENDRKRFESAYLELRDKIPPQLPLTASSFESEMHVHVHVHAQSTPIRVWHDKGEVLRVDVIPRDPIAVEAERIAKLPGMTALFDGKTAPLEAIDRILREVRK